MDYKYRKDIDGFRAIAVVSVILFHLGYLSNGYLGVDIFFVISGFLITGIVYNELLGNNFSALKFYERRLRRIFPLVIFTILVAFILGLLFMLPDDLENLCQSIFASNFSANNILMLITSSDYWAVKNDYKPLMHTWSLGIEEQFYLFYPIIFLFLKGEKKKFILPLLLILSTISIILFLLSNNPPAKFYLIQYRFFELSIGGIGSILIINYNFELRFSKLVLFSMFIGLLSILFLNLGFGNDLKVIITTLLTTGLLMLGNQFHLKNKLYSNIITNKLIVSIGKISFSLYMWHQIIFAFARYFVFETIMIQHSFLLLAIIILLSIFSYHFIENPFRKKDYIKTKPLLIIIGFFFIVSTFASFYVYAIGGIVRDVPELGIEKNKLNQNFNFFSSENNIHIKYNEDVRNYNRKFNSFGKKRVLVIGDSYGRDFSNVLLESKYNSKIELSYIDLTGLKPNNLEYQQRFDSADIIFVTSMSSISLKLMESIKQKYKFDINKVWIVGTKDFGNSNGIFYNNSRRNHDYTERTLMKKGVYELNILLEKQWGKRYIDLISLIIDSNNKVLVFTPNGKFISQDAEHLTKDGALFFGNLLENKLDLIFNQH